MACSTQVMDETLEKLRHYKQVSIQIGDTIKSGQEETIIPDVLYKSFMEPREEPVSYEEAMHSGANGSDIAGCHGLGRPLSGSGGAKCPFIKDEQGYWIEYGDPAREGAPHYTSASKLSLAPSAESIYRAHFHEQEHWNFYVEEPDVGPCMLSIKTEVEEKRETFRLFLRSAQQFVHGIIPASNLAADRHNLDDVVGAIGKEMGFTQSFRKASGRQTIEDKLLRVDETFASSQLKVGVLHVKKGQVCEKEIFGNIHDPGHFDKFLELLGEKIPLFGFDGFLGGLDNSSNLTGEESVYANFTNHEIMYHVSTLLPYSPKDPQQVCKKRHIGNDLLAVVFLEDEGTVFSPSLIQSHFLHSYIVVQLVNGCTLEEPKYRIASVSRNLVPWFGPSLYPQTAFAHGELCKNFLRTKVINAVRATYLAPKFVRMTCRSRSQLLSELITFCDEDLMTQRRSRPSKRLTRKGSWLPLGAHRPPSPLIDGAKQKYENSGKLAHDFQKNLRCADLADVVFYVGQAMTPVYAVKAILACRSKVFYAMFFEANQAALSKTALRRNKTVINPKPPTPVTPRRLSSTPTAPQKKFGGLKLRKGSSFDVSGSERSSFKEKHNISESYHVLEWTDTVFSEVIAYLMTGSCTIKSSTVVGLACAAEYYELEDLRQACQDRFADCLHVDTVCHILGEIELYYDYHTSKNMLVKVLHYVEEHAVLILRSPQFLLLSERMVHLVVERDLQAEEIVKVRAILDWGERNFPSVEERKQRIGPILKDIRLQFISAADLMKVVVPADVVATDAIMAALAYQLDPASVNLQNYRMLQPRKSPDRVISETASIHDIPEEA